MTIENAKSILKEHNLEADGKHLFEAFNNIELLEALLTAGADANHIQPEFNVPVLSLAHSRNEYANFRLLLEHGANPDAPSSLSANREPIIFEIASPQKGIDSLLRPMIEAGINLNQLHPESGYTLLQHAASRYYVSLENLEFLIANGADPNLPNPDGMTLYGLIEGGKINLSKTILLALTKYHADYVERQIAFQFVAPPQKPELDTHFSHSRGSFRGIKVLGKIKDTLTVRMYRTKRHDVDFPRTHTDSLNIIFSLLESSGTPSAWKDAASIYDFTQNHAAVARQYIKSHEVSNFDLTLNADLWEERVFMAFDDIAEETRRKLQQATIEITVYEPEMLETIEVGSWVKVPEFNVSPLWYLENKKTFRYYFFYVSGGGRWMAKEGELGTEAKGKVIGGISKGYYKEENIRAETFVSKKFDEGYELVYKNFDTAYNLEEAIEEAARQAKIDNNKSQDYSEYALEAIKNRDVAKLAEILETGVHPDTLKDKYGNLALEDVLSDYKLQPANLDMLELLLGKGANPNHEAYRREPLLQKVSRHPKSGIADDMVRALLDAGADISAVASETYQNTSSLQAACRGGMLWFIDYLIQKGADVDYKDENGLTALNYAVKAKQNAVEAIDILLKNGADKKDLYTFSYRKNVFEYAENPDTVRKLVDLGLDINMPTNSSDFPAILTVAATGSLEMFDTFLKLGAMDEMHRILHRLHEPLDRNDQHIVERQVEKMRIIHNLGHSLISSSDGNPIERFVDKNLSRRKKITKWEEKALLDLWEMDCAPRRMHKLNALLEYATKAGCKPMMEKCQQHIINIQAALN